MLKSHFKIQQEDEEEELVPEEEEVTPAPAEELIEEKDEVGPRSLNKSEVSVRLSWLGKTPEGDGFTYLKAQCTNMRLTEISAIKTFTYLQFVNLSHNFLTTEALQEVTGLPYLLLIHADKNKLDSAELKRCQFLQVIIFNKNFITTIEHIFQPELRTLEVGYNQITEMKFKHLMPTVQSLDFRYNLLTEIGELNFPKLDSLYLAGNKISSLVGIDSVPTLRVLHVRNNPIRFLNGFETPMPKLEYLNLRNCKIGTLRQVKKLQGQPALEALVLKGTPYMGGTGKEDPDEPTDEPEDPEARIEVLAVLHKLKRLNKGVFTPEEREEAKALQAQWLEEGEKEDEEEVVEEEGKMEEEPEQEED